MAQSFLEQLQSVMGTEFKELGITLKLAAQNQAANAENNKALLDAVQTLTDSHRSLQETMAHMMERQELFAGELGNQKEKLDTVCTEISRDVSNQLYTFQQMRTVYEDKK